jgi:hypothetical protein
MAFHCLKGLSRDGTRHIRHPASFASAIPWRRDPEPALRIIAIQHDSSLYRPVPTASPTDANRLESF